MIHIEAVFHDKPFPLAHVLWGCIAGGHLDRFGDVSVVDGFSGKSMKFRHVSAYLEKLKDDSFFIEMDNDRKIQFGYIADLKFSRLDIVGLAESNDETEEWIGPLLDDRSFVQARVADREYDRWQNMEEPRYYESRGVDHSNLPKKDNGQPFPLSAEIIDTSGNPGRWVLRNGYIESVGSTMWLSKTQLDRLNVTTTDIEQAGFVRSSEGDNYVKLKVADECFSTSEGVEGELQRELRRLLYKEIHSEDSQSNGVGR